MADGFSLRFKNTTYDNAEVGMSAAIRELKAAWSGSVQTAKMALLRYLDDVAEEVVAANSSPWAPGRDSPRLQRRTGASMQSVLRSVKVAGTSWETLSGEIGGRSTLAIHEFGGTIRARGKLLTIPLPAALSSRGTAPLFARQWKNTFVARSKAGNLIIFQNRPSGIVPLYVLRSSVYIPPRLGMRAELEEQMPYFVTRIVDRVARDIMDQMGAT